MSDLNQLLEDLDQKISDLGIHLELNIIGAYALYLHGLSSRITMDIDTFKEITENRLKKIIDEIGEKTGIHSWLNDDSATLILPPGIEQRLLEYKKYSHIKIFYASRFDLILLKIAAYFYRGNYEKKDLDDLKYLNPNPHEVNQGIDFLKKYHKPEIKSFADDFLVEVEHFQRLLMKELYE